jgi:hypothetical protein
MYLDFDLWHLVKLFINFHMVSYCLIKLVINSNSSIVQPH